MESVVDRRTSDLLNLTGKTVVVTGGAMGIGRAISKRLAEAGANVIISDINLEKANETVKDIKNSDGKALAIKADVTSPTDAEMVLQKAIEEFGSIDIIVNNAGIYPMTPFLEMSEEIWYRVISINLKGFSTCPSRS